MSSALIPFRRRAQPPLFPRPTPASLPQPARVQMREENIAAVKAASRAQIIADMLSDMPDADIPDALAAALATRTPAAVEDIGQRLGRMGHLRARRLL